MSVRKSTQRATAFALCAALSACAAEGLEGTSIGEAEQAETITPQTFLINYKTGKDLLGNVTYSIPASAAADIAAAGGSVVATYPDIGVAIASSTKAAFLTAIATKSGVLNVGASTGAGVSGLASTTGVFDIVKRTVTTILKPLLPQSSPAPFAGMQWNNAQIHVSEAQKLQKGASNVLVAVMDSGIDVTQPDLVGQVKTGVSCIGGVADTTQGAWGSDGIGHGTHVAGIIGAKVGNGIGIDGIAPGARLASIKVTDDGLVYPEAFVCGMVWAAKNNVDVLNASIYLDPWYYACPGKQDAIIEASQRAANFAYNKGVTTLVASSNENQDLANPGTTDPFSPTDGPTAQDPIGPGCKPLPAGLDHVFVVSATGSTSKLAYYSNYGKDIVDLTAPGGDLHLGTSGNPSGQILSTTPGGGYYFWAARFWGGRVGVGCASDPNVDSQTDEHGNFTGTYLDCADQGADPNHCFDWTKCKETYALLQGTSQAAPHASGVAALALSSMLLNNTLGSGATKVTNLMNRILPNAQKGNACPTGVYQPFPSDMPAETCSTSTATLNTGLLGLPQTYSTNGFYGFGQVDAYNAVVGSKTY